MATSLHEGPTNQLDLPISGVEASAHSSNVHCTDKTSEAAEALLHVESPTCFSSSSPGMKAEASPLPGSSLTQEALRQECIVVEEAAFSRSSASVMA
uniref:Transcription factor Elf N-terminal domain-containing protein n=1 Tax=Nomascus leucogenys TaxID=61853 RepID=A0A2I3GJ65_NOMLE